MSILKQINQAGLLESKPLIKPADMEVNKVYTIVNLQYNEEKFGEQTRIEMKEFYVFFTKEDDLRLRSHKFPKK
jgi:hypothetical protein